MVTNALSLRGPCFGAPRAMLTTAVGIVYGPPR
jgi:hypothetical protein